MKLYEYQAKICFQKLGIPIPQGHLIESSAHAEYVIPLMRFPLMIKGQILAGGRAKYNIIHTAHTPQEALSYVTNLLHASVDGLFIPSVLLEEYIESDIHYYVGIVNDRNARKPVLVASMSYGADIEEVAKSTPQYVAKQWIDPLTGLHSYQSLHIADDLNFPKYLWRKFDKIAQALYQCYIQYDATLTEINPIAYTTEHGFVALDGKIKIDDNALYRQPEICAWQEALFTTDMERLAHDVGISYVKLDGQIGCIVNGAALAMTMMDMTHLYGGNDIRPASFLDIGGGADAERVINALKIVFSDNHVKAVICSIFGGMTRCDEIAEGIVRAYQFVNPNIKTIVRLQGTNALNGWEIIQGANLPNLQIANSLSDAVKLAVDAVRGV